MRVAFARCNTFKSTFGYTTKTGPRINEGRNLVMLVHSSVALKMRWPRGACCREMQARIPSADYTSAVAAGARDTSERNGLASCSYNTFEQTPDSGLRHENLDN
jgi:hypothetical protein